MRKTGTVVEKHTTRKYLISGKKTVDFEVMFDGDEDRSEFQSPEVFASFVQKGSRIEVESSDGSYTVRKARG